MTDKAGLLCHHLLLCNRFHAIITDVSSEEQEIHASTDLQFLAIYARYFPNHCAYKAKKRLSIDTKASKSTYPKGVR